MDGIGYSLRSPRGAWFVHVTKRNYRPVQQIVSLIQTNSLKNQSGGKSGDSEFGFIQHTLEHLMEETEQFREQHQKSLFLHKKYLFQEALDWEFYNEGSGMARRIKQTRS